MVIISDFFDDSGLKDYSLKFKSVAKELVDHEVSPEAEMAKSYFRSAPECKDLLGLWKYQMEVGEHQSDRLAQSCFD